MGNKLWFWMSMVVAMGLAGVASGSPVWTTYNGHEYALTETRGNWADAQAEAESYGGYLVSLTTAEENSWVAANFSDGDNMLFIGLYQPAGSEEPSGGWSWTSGEPFEYSNWIPGEPNEFMAGDDYGLFHLTMYGSPADVWFDAGIQGWPVENSPFLGVMERVPEPTTLALLAAGALFLRKRKSE